LPADLAHAAAGHALSTLGGAIATAETLPAGQAIAIETTARAAFTDAMRLVAVFGGTMMLLAAWMASHLMRDGEGEGHVASVANEASGA
jgi:DHA2 family multidrug resistance protein-like MFS transporter